MGNCFSGGSSKTKGQSVQQSRSETTEKPARFNKPTRSKGHQLDTQPETLSPKEAAAKAAEKRLSKQTSETGTLGQKLNRERHKSMLQQRRENAQMNLQKRNNEPLIYD